MCEYEEGWHLAECFLPITELSIYSAYLARVMNIIKNGNQSSELKIFFSDEGNKLMGEIDSKAVNEKIELVESYTSLRAFFISQLEKKQVFSLIANTKDFNKMDLELCEMKNGKVLWLCQKHIEKTNATVIKDTRGTNVINNDLSQNKMLEFIQLEDIGVTVDLKA